MKTFIILAAFLTVAFSQQQNVTTVDPGNGTEPAANSTVAPATTTVVVTTVLPTNATDPAGNSTSPAPTTLKPTTVQPTNSTDSGNSTTPAKTTAKPTTAKPTTPKATTPAPATTTPEPAVETVNATVSVNGSVCIVLQGQMRLIVSEGNDTVTVDVPQSAAVSGNCSLNESTQFVELSFGPNKDWKLRFTFSRDANKDVTISEIDVTYDLQAAAEVEATKTENVKGNFLKSGSDGDYYLCNSNSTLVQQNGVTLTTSNLKYKAFNDGKDASFDGSATECPADEETSSVVPIAVGAALAGLVVIVLIAYLIGRRRSRQTGYESV